MKNDQALEKVADAELEQVSGGGKLWDLFTAEFIERFGDPKRRAITLEEEEEARRYGITTLEMRANPKQKRETEDSQKIIKI